MAEIDLERVRKSIGDYLGSTNMAGFMDPLSAQLLENVGRTPGFESTTHFFNPHIRPNIEELTEEQRRQASIQGILEISLTIARIIFMNYTSNVQSPYETDLLYQWLQDDTPLTHSLKNYLAIGWLRAFHHQAGIVVEPAILSELEPVDNFYPDRYFPFPQI